MGGSKGCVKEGLQQSKSLLVCGRVDRTFVIKKTGRRVDGCVDGWVGGWMGGRKSCFKDWLQQSEI